MAEPEGKSIEIKHIYPEGLQTRFVNHVVCQRSPAGEFYISFYEIIPPVIVGDVEERKRQLGKIGVIEAQCVARIAVTEKRLAEILEALTENLKKYNASAKSSAPAESSKEDVEHGN